MSSTPDDSGTDSVVEVEFRIDDPQYPLVSIPEKLGCRVRVQQIVPRGNGTYAIFYDVTGVDVERAVALVSEHAEVEARVVSTRDDGGTVEVLVMNPEEHFVVALTDAGAIPRDVWSGGGVARIVAEIPAGYPTSEVVERFLAVHPTVDVVACRQRDHSVPMFTRREFEQAVEEILTPRQREVLRTAYAEGYFESPRGKSGAEMAAKLGISHPTFSQHLRTAERKVFSLLFSGSSQTPDEGLRPESK